jgi:hypothetical protein
MLQTKPTVLVDPNSHCAAVETERSLLVIIDAYSGNKKKNKLFNGLTA